MKQIPSMLAELAELNPCIKFIIDNYDMLCTAHYGRTVMVMNSSMSALGGPEAYVEKTFGSMIEAMLYTRAMEMGHVPYALKECNGSPVYQELLYSKGCRHEN